MGVIKRQGILNSIIIYVGIGLGFISTLYLYPNILTQEQYGLTRLLLSIAFIFSQIVHVGMKNIPIKFFPYFEDKTNNHNGFLFLIFVVPFIGFIIFIFLFFGFKYYLLQYYQDSSELFVEYYLYLIPLVLGIVYFEITNSFTRALHKSVPGSIVNDIVLKAIHIALLIIYFFGFISFKSFVNGFVFTYALQFLILVFYLIKIGEFNLKPDFKFLNKRLTKEIGSYGIYSMLGGVTSLFVGNIDIIMLGALTGLSNTGVYAIAFYIGNVIAVPKRSISKIAAPLISKKLAEHKFDDINEIYTSSSLNQIIPGCLLLVGVWANMDNLLYILPPEYSGAKWVIIIIGISKLIDMVTGVNGHIILNSKYYRTDLLFTLFLVFFSIASNYLLIPIYGIVGAAIATSLSLFVYNLTKCIYVWIKFSMHPFNSNLITVFLISALLIYLSSIVGMFGGVYLDIIIRSLIITIIFGGSMLVFNISNEVNKIWEDILSTFKKLVSQDH